MSARHTCSMVTVSLRQLSHLEALDIIEGRRPIGGWARDFPTETDIAVARMSQPASTTSNTPWSSPWLMICDDVVVGMLGIKGPPKDGHVEVGYGVVPSCQGRGVATAALRALLERLVGHELDVRAETATWNVASQGVLRQNGFVEVGRTANLEDGELIEWRRTLS